MTCPHRFVYDVDIQNVPLGTSTKYLCLDCGFKNTTIVIKTKDLIGPITHQPNLDRIYIPVESEN